VERYRSRNGYREFNIVRFLSTRELRNRPGSVRQLAQEDELVLTANGKPVAILLGVEDDDFEETALIIRQIRAQRAVSRMRRQAARRGLNRLSLADINAEIRAARSQRRQR
jgi:PHD/YefM family antitoxin component YafN of YafNO toxin-antitoxin module